LGVGGGILILALTIIDALLAIGVIVTVVMQSAKGAGLGAIGGGAQTLFGQKKSKDEMLARLATYFAGAWMTVTLILAILTRRLG